MIISIIAVFFLFCISFTASAQDDLTKEQFDSINADSLEQSLPKSTKEYLKKYNIFPDSIDVQNSISANNVFAALWSMLTGGIKKPLASALCLSAIIVLCSVVSSTEGSIKSNTVDYVGTVSASVTVIGPILTMIFSCAKAVESISDFMIAFIPVFFGAVATNSQIATATAGSATLLFASEIIGFSVSHIIIPFCGLYCALSLCRSMFSFGFSFDSSELVKKTALWIFGLVISVFSGILSVQTTITSSADTARTQSIKYAISHSVPIAGTAVGEALNTVKGCMGIVTSTVGMYGIIALAVIVLPVIIELSLYRLSLGFSLLVSSVFSKNNLVKLIKTTDDLLAILIGVIAFFALLFIVSVTVVVKAGH